MQIATRPHHTQIVEKNMYNSGMTTDTAKRFRLAARYFGSGMSKASACAKAGITQTSYNRLVETYDSAERHHKKAFARRADAVEQSVFELATGKAGKRRDEYDAEGELRGSSVDVLAPDIQAAKYYLNNVAPSEWREKVDVQHSGEVKYEPLAITVKPVTIDVEATDAETVPKKGTLVNL